MVSFYGVILDDGINVLLGKGWQGHAPTITQALNPDNGPAAGNTEVTITGTYLGTVTGVTFGGTAGTGLTIVSPTSLTVHTPAHAAGAVNVVVTNPYGSATATGGYTYT